MVPVLADAPNPQGASQAPGRVLVVEDNDDLRTTLSYILEANGYEVRAAEHGRAALHQLPGFAPDVILLDLHMPVMDGPTFYRHLRASDNAALAQTPVLVLTANPERRLDGEEPTLTKPFEVDELLAALARMR